MNCHALTRRARLLDNLRFFATLTHPAAWLAHPGQVNRRWAR